MFGCCQVIGAHLALLSGEEWPLWGKGKNPSAPSRDEGLVSLVLPATAVCHRRVGHQLSFFPLRGLKSRAVGLLVSVYSTMLSSLAQIPMLSGDFLLQP